MLLWSAFIFEGKISSCLYNICSLILVQCLLKFPGMIIMLYLNKLFYTVHMPEESDIVLKFIMHNLRNRGRAVISAHVTRYISIFFMSLWIYLTEFQSGKCVCRRAGCFCFLESAIIYTSSPHTSSHTLPQQQWASFPKLSFVSSVSQDTFKQI